MTIGTKYRSSHPVCDICQEREATYDAPTKYRGVWANMCSTCYARHGIDGVGTHFAIREEGPTHGLAFDEWSRQMEASYAHLASRDPLLHMYADDPGDHVDYDDYYHLPPKAAAKSILDQISLNLQDGIF